MKIITDFHELHPPEVDNRQGDIDKKDWCTFDKNGSGVFYLLNDGSYTLGNILYIIPTNVYFDTEEDCHIHAAEYYMKYGIDYPYMDEWKASYNNAVNNSSSNLNSSDCSQVMVFI